MPEELCQVSLKSHYVSLALHSDPSPLKICDYAQKDAFVAKIVNTYLTKIFMAIFAPDERLSSSATLLSAYNHVLYYSVDLRS